MYAAVCYLTEFEFKNKTANYFEDDRQKELYGIAVRQLAVMASAKTINISGRRLTYKHIIDKLNEKVRTIRGVASIDDQFIMQAIDAVVEVSEKKEIKNVKKYLQACLWDALETGEFRNIADVGRDWQ